MNFTAVSGAPPASPVTANFPEFLHSSSICLCGHPRQEFSMKFDQHGNLGIMKVTANNTNIDNNTINHYPIPMHITNIHNISNKNSNNRKLKEKSIAIPILTNTNKKQSIEPNTN